MNGYTRTALLLLLLAKLATAVPVHFEPDSTSGRFLARGDEYTASLAATEAVFRVGSAAVRLRLDGSRPAYLEGGNPLDSYSNYFVGRDSTRWRARVPHFARLHATGVYPGIDLLYHGRQQSLEYAFQLAPGANPAEILLTVESADRVTIEPAGDLLVEAGRTLVVDGGKNTIEVVTLP